ncbi:MAG: hypothetical protein IJV31_10505 [Clostridia bacterium]|nr:hypothetical protein [Clostridia bacterium]
MMNLENPVWINDIYYVRGCFLKAKDCNFNKDKFQKEVEKELEFKINLITPIQQGYYRIKKNDDFERGEYGEYCYMPCEKGKGAVLYYYAGFEIRGGKIDVKKI